MICVAIDSRRLVHNSTTSLSADRLVLVELLSFIQWVFMNGRYRRTESTVTPVHFTANIVALSSQIASSMSLRSEILFLLQVF